jgi:hypothetical protein
MAAEGTRRRLDGPGCGRRLTSTWPLRRERRDPGRGLATIKPVGTADGEKPVPFRAPDEPHGGKGIHVSFASEAGFLSNYSSNPVDSALNFS